MIYGITPTKSMNGRIPSANVGIKTPVPKIVSNTFSLSSNQTMVWSSNAKTTVTKNILIEIINENTISAIGNIFSKLY